MPALRSRVTTHGRNAAGARSLWRATGMTDGDFGKPIVAIANSYTQFVPGHVHLKDLGEIVADGVRAAGGVPREFHTIAVDDGIAMGHGGMLYSLPSREVIADAVEYMVNGHAADALVCISNCDKITPGMLNAAMRLNIPTVFVSGGPMEAGKAVVVDGVAQAPDRPHHGDLGVGVGAGRRRRARARRALGLPDVRLVLGDVHRQLDELPHRGARPRAARQRLDVGHARGAPGAVRAGGHDRDGAGHDAGTRRDDASALPRSIATRKAFENAMALDVAMGGSTNTVLHILAAAQEGEIDFDLAAIDAVSRRVPCLAKVAPNSDYHMEDVHRAGGIPAILGELRRAGLLKADVHTVHAPSLEAWLDAWDIRAATPSEEAVELFHAAPGGVRTTEAFSTTNRWSSLDTDAAGGCIRDVAHAYTRDGGLAVLRGNIAPDGAVIKAAGIDEELWHFAGPARVVESQEEAVSVILAKQVQPGDVLVVRYEGPSGGPGMQEMLHPTAFLKGAGLGRVCALITDGRFSGGSSGISVGHISPEAAAGGVIGLVEDGDRVVIDVRERTLHLDVADEVLAERRAKVEASERPWQPRDRDRPVSKALRAYAALATSAHTGAVRRVP